MHHWSNTYKLSLCIARTPVTDSPVTSITSQPHIPKLESQTLLESSANKCFWSNGSLPLWHKRLYIFIKTHLLNTFFTHFFHVLEYLLNRVYIFSKEHMSYLHWQACTNSSIQCLLPGVHSLPTASPTCKTITCDVLQQHLALNLHGDGTRAWEWTSTPNMRNEHNYSFWGVIICVSQC